MSIPEFFDGYHLPPGEHKATLSEVEIRFGSNTDARKKVWYSFQKALERLKELGLEPDELYIDGSFVTGREDPGDVDSAALVKPGKVLRAKKAANEHDKRAIDLFANPNTQELIRDILGAHVIVADTPMALDYYKSLFKRGLPGVGLREPDPKRDPIWVKKPREKGIIIVVENV